MRRLIAASAATLTLGAATACSIIPPIPAPIQAIGNYIVKEIFWSTIPDPTGVHAPREPHLCAIVAEPGDPSLHAPYSTVDAYWNANGWQFWTECVITARTLGRTLPVVKITQDPNTPGAMPKLEFKLLTAPVFGRGSGIYFDPQASNVPVWRRAYIEVSS